MIDLTQDVRDLTARLVDIPSVSGSEAELAAEIEDALRQRPHLATYRHGNTVVARTERGRPQRVLVAGHIDTVPVAGNLPSRREGEWLYGCGSTDMKGGLAVGLKLAATVTDPQPDVTYVYYDCEEVDAARNGLRLLGEAHPELLAADFAVLMEPTGGLIEGGCQGTMRVEVHATGEKAHTARPWMGRNAIHEAGGILDSLRAYEPRRAVVQGLEFTEALNAVTVTGGGTGNVVPDACTVTVNFRFAPDRTEDEAAEWLRQRFDAYQVTVVDSAPAALPNLGDPAAEAFVSAIGGEPRGKQGWTDVARMGQFGVPAVNYGPGDPALAHTREEHVSLEAVLEVEKRMVRWLSEG